MSFNGLFLVICSTCLGELHTFRLNGSNSFSSSVEKGFSHGRLVDTLHTPCWRSISCRQRSVNILTIQSKVRRLVRHLHECIGTEAVACDEILPVALELQRLTVILTNQVAQPRLRELDAHSQLRRQVPLELLRCRIDGLVAFDDCILTATRRLIRSSIWGKLGVEEGGSGWIDGTCEEHQSFGVDVRCEPNEMR
jgi:hypothetical protein